MWLASICGKLHVHLNDSLISQIPASTSELQLHRVQPVSIDNDSQKPQKLRVLVLPRIKHVLWRHITTFRDAFLPISIFRDQLEFRCRWSSSCSGRSYNGALFPDCHFLKAISSPSTYPRPASLSATKEGGSFTHRESCLCSRCGERSFYQKIWILANIIVPIDDMSTFDFLKNWK